MFPAGDTVTPDLMQSPVQIFTEQGGGIVVRMSSEMSRWCPRGLCETGSGLCVSAQVGVWLCVRARLQVGLSPSIQHPASDAEVFGRKRLVSMSAL